MNASKLIKVTYFDPKSDIRLLCYADTVVWDTKPAPTLIALRFGGYPERVQGLADAIYGGATIEIEDDTLINGYSSGIFHLLYRKALSELHSGEPRIITKGKLPDSHIVFLDEIFKASDGILNALLTALNERRYTNEGKTIHIPAISFFSASNEIPNFANPEEKILKPLYDRFELKVVTEYVEDRAARLAILKQKQTTRGAAQAPVSTVSLAELEAMQEEVLQVSVPDSINELMDDILCELREKGVHISDRKYFNYAPIAQAKAWLCGRDQVEPSDLNVLCAYLWTAPEERTIIGATLERMCNDPLKNRLDSILTQALEGYQEFEDSADAPPARRIGKLRDEFMSLYVPLNELLTSAQSDGEKDKINACLAELEQYSRKAHEAVEFSYVPLQEIYALKAS